jgi:hypothetical protein
VAPVRHGLVDACSERRHGRRPQTKVERVFVTDIIRDAFGDRPDLESRHQSSALPTHFLGLACMAPAGVGLVVMVALNATGVDGRTAAIPGSVGLCLGAVPFFSMFIWAIRGTISELHYRSWVKRGTPGDELPPASSQPRDRDLLIGLPWAALSIGSAVYLLVDSISGLHSTT